jgi:hypothetical protein
MRGTTPRAITHAVRDAVHDSVTDRLADALHYPVSDTLAGTFWRTTRGTSRNSTALSARGPNLPVCHAHRWLSHRMPPATGRAPQAPAESGGSPTERLHQTCPGHRRNERRGTVPVFRRLRDILREMQAISYQFAARMAGNVTGGIARLTGVARWLLFMVYACTPVRDISGGTGCAATGFSPGRESARAGAPCVFVRAARQQPVLSPCRVR